jgi:hypothetical protein
MPYTGPVPPTPTATSTDAQWSNWWAYKRQEVAEQQVEASDRLAASNERLAAAMTGNLEAVRAMALALNAPVPRAPATRNELAERFLASMPQLTGMTDLQQVDLAFKRADDFLRRAG